ncbi:polyamine ABC transporter ATP-binding protein [Fusobacterium animalis]|uniref:Polyamine ABC transporter ATP-binding protein n=1 Tax=Fusobacterium animalis TaxID=76859 RepID=A0A2G9FE13_9FUSO|nr:ABC transporter ATP-binding protein [Fusobacterium animalis]PIM89128.1 polyamine ABC transporter ATP-binding protein [Fusobacterium animalis]PIM91370.1 polyamine ABC transporter ATP-binding protein [Fusobacterium animalis]
MASVTITGVTKSFGNVKVLQEFNQKFEDGEFITLLGPSGCGKTTMLRLIAGFEKPSSGEIYIGNKLVSSEKEFLPPEKRGIGMVFQSYAVWPHMNVFDNIAYPLKIQKINKNEIEERVNQVLKIVHLEQYKDRFPSELSGGQQQRVALGRALVAQPEILLLDEPLSNLDAKLREEMRYEIKEITKKLKITVIYVTHDQIEAMTMSDRIVLINKGEVQQVAPPQEIYSKPKNMFVANFVGKVDFIKGKVEGSKILLDNSNGQTLPNKSSFKGNVVVAIRPENAILSDDGEITGKVYSKFYLGDCNDLRVEIGNGNILRMIARASTYNTLNEGDEVKIKILDYFIFKDDGKDQIKIMT